MFTRYPFLVELGLRHKFSRREREIFESWLAASKKARLSEDAEEFERAVGRSADEIRELESWHLVITAIAYDIDPPPQSDTSSWESSSIGRVLTVMGKLALRKRIDEEKERRFEVRARWIRLLAPLIAALAGLIGTITGLVAVIKK